MLRMAARTGKVMSPAITKLPAFTALLGSIGRVNKSNCHSFPLRLTGARLDHHAIGPLTKFAVGSRPSFSFTGLLNPQILEYEYGVSRNLIAQFCCGLGTKRLGSVMLFTSQPFEKATDTVGVLLLCLTDGQLSLKPLADFTGFLVNNFLFTTGDKDSLVISGGNQCVGSPKINSYGDVSHGIRNIKGKTKRDSTVISDSNAVIAYSGIEV